MTARLDGAMALAWITSFSDRFAMSQHDLTALDRLAGDGDFGTNIASALGRVKDALPSADHATCASVFAAAATGFLATGGTSGPLFGMWFRRIAGRMEASASVDDLAAGVVDGLAMIRKLGGASVGDSTMVDALAPAAAALSAAAAEGEDLPTCLARTAAAAREGALSTGDLVASRGRASYVGDLARGVLDPGAVTIALFFESGAAVAGDPTKWSPLTATAAPS